MSVSVGDCCEQAFRDPSSFTYPCPTLPCPIPTPSDILRCKAKPASQFAPTLVTGDGRDDFPHPYGFMAEGVTLVPAPLEPLLVEGERLYAEAATQAATEPFTTLHHMATMFHQGQHYRLPMSQLEVELQGRASSLMAHSLPEGLAVRSCYPPLTQLTTAACDVVFVADQGDDNEKGKVALAVGEVKRTFNSTLEGLPQAMLGAMGATCLLRTAGLAPHHVVVPFFSYTGLAIIFGAAYLLPHGLPCVAQYAHILLDTRRDALRAAAHMWALRRLAAQMATVVRSLPRGLIEAARSSNATILLPDTLLHVKAANSSLFFERRRDEMHGRQCVFEDLRRARVPAVLPLACLAHYKEEFGDFYAFPNMRLVGFVDGLPQGMEAEDTQQLRLAWLEAVIAALRRLHRAGYAHLDIHPYNVLWRRVSGAAAGAAAAGAAGAATPAGAAAAGAAVAATAAVPDAAAARISAAVSAAPTWAASAARHWASEAAKLTVVDSQHLIEVVLIDWDSACAYAEPVRDRLVNRLRDSPWANACHLNLLTPGHNPTVQPDWYMLLGVVKLLNWSWETSDLQKLQDVLTSLRAEFMVAAAKVWEQLEDVTVPLPAAVTAMRNAVRDLNPPTPPRKPVEG